MARYPYTPLRGAVNDSTEPRFTSTAMYMGMGLPLSVGLKSAPVMAMKVLVVKRSVGPARQNSRTGALSSLSTSKLAMRKARRSITPEGEKPLPMYP